MFAHLLVALDGSALAEQILPQVEALAARFAARVTLLRATTPPETIIAELSAGAEPGATGVLDPTPIIEAEQQEAREYLARVAARLQAHGLSVAQEQPEDAAGDAILERADALGVDLIAMTTHGRSGLGRLVFGSVADTVLRKSSCPILLVRVTEEQRPTSEGPLR
jgi:nucleotide-binding universal stress UspA family protein